MRPMSQPDTEPHLAAMVHMASESRAQGSMLRDLVQEVLGSRQVA
jgi:hypothetical protein